MTDTEREQYNKLSQREKEEYEYQKKKRPNWSHNQIYLKVIMDRQTEVVIDQKGGTVDPKTLVQDPVFLKQVLEGTKRTLIQLGVFIGEVFEAIDNALTNLGYLIMSGVRYIGDKLKDFWDWLTT